MQTSNHIPHGTLDVPYIGHHLEDIVSYTALPPDGGCASLTNTYASCSSGNSLSSNLLNDGDIATINSCAAMPLEFDVHKSLSIFASSLFSNGNSTKSDLNFPSSIQLYTVANSVVGTFQSNTLYQKSLPQFPGLLPSSVYSAEEGQLAGAGGKSNSHVNVGLQCEMGPETPCALYTEEDREMNVISDIAATNDHSQLRKGMLLLDVCNMLYIFCLC